MRSVPILSVVLISLLSGPPALAQAPRLPGLGSADPRQGVDMQALPWRALGRVQTELGTRCTGTLIAPAAVLTAAHCLVTPRTRQLVQPGSVHFLLGADRGQHARHSRVLRFTLADGFDAARNGPPSADWAVLTLATPMALPDRILPLATTPPRPGETIALGGYGQDRAEAVLADPACRFLGFARDEVGGMMLAHSCAATRGTSGAALLREERPGEWSVLGVQSLARVGSQGGYAAPVGEQSRR